MLVLFLLIHIHDDFSFVNLAFGCEFEFVRSSCQGILTAQTGDVLPGKIRIYSCQDSGQCYVFRWPDLQGSQVHHFHVSGTKLGFLLWNCVFTCSHVSAS